MRFSVCSFPPMADLMGKVDMIIDQFKLVVFGGYDVYGDDGVTAWELS